MPSPKRLCQHKKRERDRNKNTQGSWGRSGEKTSGQEVERRTRPIPAVRLLHDWFKKRVQWFVGLQVTLRGNQKRNVMM